MKDVVSAILDTGLDISTRTSLKAVMLKLGFDVNLVDQIYVKTKNDANRKAFVKVPFAERGLFLPHCMRNSKSCKAELGPDGYECLNCGACPLGKIKAEANRIGYGGVHIVPGGSMIFKILARKKYKALLGVACYFELADGLEKTSLYHMPSQGVPLIKDGCRDTIADVDEILVTLALKE